VLADLMDLDDVRVVELGRRLGLAAEPGQLRPAGAFLPEDQLEGDDTAEGRLPGAVDDAHAAAAQLPQDLVAG
jgi:hypothetical protein